MNPPPRSIIYYYSSYSMEHPLQSNLSSFLLFHNDILFNGYRVSLIKQPKTTHHPHGCLLRIVCNMRGKCLSCSSPTNYAFNIRSRHHHHQQQQMVSISYLGATYNKISRSSLGRSHMDPDEQQQQELQFICQVGPVLDHGENL